MPAPLDELPIHQVPLSVAHMASSDRNAYDRCYLNAHDRTGDVFLITGLGVYPNLGVIDAYATVRSGDRQVTVRCSDALGPDRSQQEVGPYRIEVEEPLRRLHLTLDADDHGVGLRPALDGLVPDDRRGRRTCGAATAGSCSTPAASPSSARGRARCGPTARSGPSPTTAGSAPATARGGSARWASPSPPGAARPRPIPASGSGGRTCRCASTATR